MKRLVFIFLLLAPLLVSAQSHLSQTLYWTRYYLRWHLHPRWTLHYELDNRQFLAPAQGQHQLISHLHLHRSFGARQQWEAWAGVSASVVSRQKPDEPPAPFRPELRPWQALSLQQKAGQFHIGHRLRWEQRFFNVFDERENRFAFRARYALTAQYPLHPHWNLKSGNEIMLQWGESQAQALDQNRLWGGLEYTIPRSTLSLELLYIWLHQLNAGGTTAYDRGVLRLTVLQGVGG